MRKRTKRILYLLLIICVLSVFVFGFSYAKYTYNTNWNKYLVSKDFYFTSDYLDTVQINNINNIWDGGSINFNIKNYVNDASVTGYDISYDISCTVNGDASNYLACHLNGTSSNSVSGVLSSAQSCVNNTNDGVDVTKYAKSDCEVNGYQWSIEKTVKDLYFDVVLTNQSHELEDANVTITATSYSPYTKTITGNFVLHKSEFEGNSVLYEYKDYNNYGRLNIYNPSNSTKCIEVSFDTSKFKLEEAGFGSYEQDENNYINKIKINIESKKSLSYIFYKEDLDFTYSINEFIINDSQAC